MFETSIRKASRKGASPRSSLSTIHGHLQVQSGLEPENDLSETETFILYAIALMYLSGSFQVSMGICNSNFRSKVENKIAKATILRFKALNLEQLALKMDSESASYQERNERKEKLLGSAILCVRKALKLYDSEKSDKPTQQIGKALCCFYIAYLHHTYGSDLKDEGKFNRSRKMASPRKHFSHGTDDRSMQNVLSDEIALDFYVQASRLFHKTQH